jgi:acyl carrier protein
MNPSTASLDGSLGTDLLRRLPAAAAEASRVFRQTGNARYLPAVVRGVLERYVPADHQSKLKGPHEQLRLIDDLGLDSLELMELALVLEDAVGLRLEENELRRLSTVRDLERALARKRPAA